MTRQEILDSATWNVIGGLVLNHKQLNVNARPEWFFIHYGHRIRFEFSRLQQAHNGRGEGM